MTEPYSALEAGDYIDFWGNESPKCPHCGEDFDIAENEAWHLYEEDDVHEVQCTSCEIDFEVRSLATWTFSTDVQEDRE